MGACITHGGSTSVIGTVYQKPPAAVSDVIDGQWIRWWGDSWNGDWIQSGATNDGPGKYHSAAFGSKTQPGTWHVAIVAGQGSSQVLSDVVTFSTSSNSDPGSCNDQVVDFQANY
jgi:hypothetical protein